MNSNEESFNRKQAMIPLIALVVCFISVASVGIAYAHNSDIRIDNNPVNEQYYTLDYTDDSGDAIYTVLEIPADTKDMTITTHVGANGTNPRTFTATIESGSFTRVFYVNLDHNMDDGQRFAIVGEVDETDSVIDTIFGTCTFAMKGGVGFTDDVTMSSVEKGLYKVILTVTVNSVDVSTLTGLVGSDAITDAESLADALEDMANHKFAVTLTAQPVVVTP